MLVEVILPLNFLHFGNLMLAFNVYSVGANARSIERMYSTDGRFSVIRFLFCLERFSQQVMNFIP